MNDLEKTASRIKHLKDDLHGALEHIDKAEAIVYDLNLLTQAKEMRSALILWLKGYGKTRVHMMEVFNSVVLEDAPLMDLLHALLKEEAKEAREQGVQIAKQSYLNITKQEESDE